MDDLRTALAMIFKRKGKDHLTAKEITMSASMDHHWFDPESAKRFVELSEELHLIRMDGEEYTPNFNYRTIEPTLDFRPGKEMLERDYPKESVFPKLLNEVTSKYQITRQEFMKRVNKKKEKTGADIEIAALLVLSEMRVDFTPYLEDVEKELMDRCMG